MSRMPKLRQVLWIIVIGWAGSSGCIHNHYYGTGTTLPGCPPVGQTVTTQVGSVCDVPNSQVTVSGGSSRSPSSAVEPLPTTNGAIVSTMPSDRVVISTPAFGPPSIGQSTSRFKWRKPDPESLPIMKVEGASDDSTIR